MLFSCQRPNRNPRHLALARCLVRRGANSVPAPFACQCFSRPAPIRSPAPLPLRCCVSPSGRRGANLDLARFACQRFFFSVRSASLRVRSRCRSFRVQAMHRNRDVRRLIGVTFEAVNKKLRARLSAFGLQLSPSPHVPRNRASTCACCRSRRSRAAVMMARMSAAAFSKSSFTTRY